MHHYFKRLNIYKKSPKKQTMNNESAILCLCMYVIVVGGIFPCIQTTTETMTFVVSLVAPQIQSQNKMKLKPVNNGVNISKAILLEIAPFVLVCVPLYTRIQY